MGKFNPPSSAGSDSGDSWMMSYSDVVTSLLAFFVLLMAISTIDQQKIEAIQESIQSEVLKQDYEKPFTSLEEKINEIIAKQKLENDVFVEADGVGINITFSSSVLYKSGSATLQTKMKPFLAEMAQMIQDMQYKQILVEVEGHTDDIPINTVQFPSNWELSATRATNVVRYFARSGLETHKLKASGFSDSRPVSPNIVNGRGSARNRALNRRVKVSVKRDESYNIINVSTQN